MRKIILPIFVFLLVACAEPEFYGPVSGSGSVGELSVSASPLTDIPALKDIVQKGVIVGRMTCRVQAGAKIFAAQRGPHHVYYFTNGSPSGAVCSNIAYNDTGMETVNGGDDVKAWEEFQSAVCGKVMLWEKVVE